MKPKFLHSTPRPRGFALVITISLVILITVLATALLGLSTIELRKSTISDARAVARANARLGLLVALGQLQKDLGDDRRISADASIISGATQPQMTGIWDSWTPDLTVNPQQAISGNSYTTEKEGRFRGWLVADPDPERTRQRSMAEESPDPAGVEIFKEELDGFDLQAGKIPVDDGAYSWAVTQEGTKAKINVGGPEDEDRNPNDSLHAQARPNLAMATGLKQPDAEWNTRFAKVLSLSQADLDESLSDSNIPKEISRDFTTQSMGLLTNAAKGGLKVDMSLGFELSDSDFDRDNLGGGVPNPFRAGATEFASSVSNNYRGQRPLFRPTTPTATHTARLDQFDAAKVLFDYPGAGVPTFNTLRSHYRIPYHLYSSQNGTTIFERPSDHVAFSRTGSVPGGLFRTPWNTPPATVTQTGIRPVIDRVMFLLSAGLTSNAEPSLVITPVITMWNPYNVALEIEGAVAYPWLDVPFNLAFVVYNGSGAELRRHSRGMADLLGRQLKTQNNHGRSVDPFFYAAVTASGNRITGNPAPIRFEPGEVRVFTSTSSAKRPFQPGAYSSPNSTVSTTGITTYLRPVESLADFSTRGGLEAIIVDTKMQASESAEILFTPATGENYPCFISVEDATRAKGSSSTTAVRGQAIVDVLQRYFGQSGEFGQGGGRAGEFRSTRQSFSSLRQEPAPFAALEFYHRYARTGQDQGSDLVYTGNPRQPWMSHYMTNASFPSGPQYKLRVRGPLTSFSGILEVEQGAGARRAFYGASNRATDGSSRLSFFEVPQAPLMSLAAFQHADLTSTPFGPANQLGNSWASAYINRNRVMMPKTGDGESARPPVYDTVYLANEALWDGFFFSSAAPVIGRGSGGGNANVWSNPNAASRTLSDVVSAFVKEPDEHPLRNPRMRLHLGDSSAEDVEAEMLSPEGCVKIAGRLMVDGAFNVNSTNVEAWVAFLSGLKGEEFEVTDGSPSTSGTPFPRFQYPTGTENDHWNGFRTLTDTQIRTLAQNIVEQNQERGPYLSLAEFVNRQVSTTASGLKGAIQAAIDDSDINGDALYDNMRLSFTENGQAYGFPAQSRQNISPTRTGVGIPGYLTQADVLQSIAPFITVRSDTFTIRGYGETRDGDGNVIAKAMCEAVVQRYPEFVDKTDEFHKPIADVNDVNKKFGRRFNVVSFRYLSAVEMQG